MRFEELKPKEVVWEANPRVEERVGKFNEKATKRKTRRKTQSPESALVEEVLFQRKN